MSGWDSRKLACEQEAAALRANKTVRLIEALAICQDLRHVQVHDAGALLAIQQRAERLLKQ